MNENTGCIIIKGVLTLHIKILCISMRKKVPTNIDPEMSHFVCGHHFVLCKKNWISQEATILQ